MYFKHQMESLIDEPTIENESCKLLIQGLLTKDEKQISNVLAIEDDEEIRTVLELLPAHHVRNFVIQLRNFISEKTSLNHLKWLQLLFTIKHSVVVAIPDGRSILVPLLAILEDTSSIAYHTKMRACRTKLYQLACKKICVQDK